MKNPMRLRVAIVAYPGAGKDTVGRMLAEEHSFDFISTSDHIQALITERGLGDTSLENMNKFSTEFRTEFGADFPTAQILRDSRDVERLALGGLRTLAEAKTFKFQRGVILVVDAPAPRRYQYALGRGRLGDRKSFDEFLAFEKMEASNTDPLKHNVNAIIRLADVKIDNDGTLNDLQRKVADFVWRLES